MRHHIWRTVDQLLGRGRLPVNSAVTAEDLRRYFEQKVAAVQAATAGATASVFTPPDHPGTSQVPSFLVFSPSVQLMSLLPFGRQNVGG